MRHDDAPGKVLISRFTVFFKTTMLHMIRSERVNLYKIVNSKFPHDMLCKLNETVYDKLLYFSCYF
jgi:hypothetical protein